MILSDSLRFTCIGSIPEMMLYNVPANSEVIQAYPRQMASGPGALIDIVRKVLEEVDKPKKGGKRKAKAGTSEPT